jgi:hypothetical protein
MFIPGGLTMEKVVNRRSFIGKSLVATAGVAAWRSLEEQNLLARMNESGQAAKSPALPSSSTGMPMGQMGDMKISRLICGGNLVGGYAHSRDLTYVSSLLVNYFTPEKVFETWRLCEEYGINTAVLDVRQQADRNINLMQKYWKAGGKIQFIGQCNPLSTDIETTLKVGVDSGAGAIFIQGGVADKWVKNKRVDLLGKAVDFIKQNNVLAGVAGHSLHVPIECEKAGLNPDFYVKTFHRDDYWSATPKEHRVEFIVDVESSDDHNKDHDNMWCINPEETAAFMSKVKKPWIAYKVLAAGAIDPKKAMEFAFKQGADFALVGMFDFQVVENATVARNAVASAQSRLRPWQA